MLGVSEASLMRWENNLRKPKFRYWPKIISFLGYDPEYIDNSTLKAVLINYRRQHGLKRKLLADRIGVDESTVLWWERGRAVKLTRSKEQLLAFFEREGIEEVIIPYFNHPSRRKK